ncbi:MAG: hypothetical protein ACFFB5_08240 [Promethearchaeota archaeon]
MDLLSDLQPTLEILDKIVAFEKKMEYNRLLLFLCLAGFIAIIGGWIEYVCYHFLFVDSTFFILGLTSIAEPVLFLGLWLIYLIPLIGIIIFTTGISPGFINWNKAYRNIGAITIGLFILTHVLVLLIGSIDAPDSQFIPIIWGTMICLGFLLASRILFLETRNKEIQLGFLAFGIFGLVLGIISSMIFYPFSSELAMFLFCNIFGVVLIGASMISYWKVGISPQEAKNNYRKAD